MSNHIKSPSHSVFSVIPVIFFMLFSGISFAQSIYDDFYSALEEGDNAKQLQLIKQMRKSKDVSAERYIAEYNYYVNIARISEGPIISTEPPEDGKKYSMYYELTDSTGAVTGYMYGHEGWDDKTADTAISIIKEGIKRYPDRLDMHFGYIHLLRQLERWVDYTEAIDKTVERTLKNKKKWEFPNTDDPIDTVLIYSFLDYERSLFESINIDDPDLNDSELNEKMGLMRHIAQSVLKIYPKDIFSFNIIAASYLATEKYDEALTWLKKAEKISPRDMTILWNIEYAYENKGDKENARKTLETIKLYGDEDAKAAADRKMKQLE